MMIKSPINVPMAGGKSQAVPTIESESVVELGLLLPAKRAAELFQLAHDRDETVAQILRKLIDRELARTA